MASSRACNYWVLLIRRLHRLHASLLSVDQPWSDLLGQKLSRQLAWQSDLPGPELCCWRHPWLNMWGCSRHNGCLLQYSSPVCLQWLRQANLIHTTGPSGFMSHDWRHLDSLWL